MEPLGQRRSRLSQQDPAVLLPLQEVEGQTALGAPDQKAVQAVTEKTDAPGEIADIVSRRLGIALQKLLTRDWGSSSSAQGVRP